MAHRKWTDEELIKAFNTSNCKKEIINKLNIPYPGNLPAISRRLVYLQLEVDRLNQDPKIPSKTKTKKLLTSEILVENCKFNYKTVRKRILAEKLLDYCCANCGITDWLSNNLIFELDHISGNPVDNRIENLRFLCPNCHSQTNTFRGKNRKKKQEKNIKYCQDCGNNQIKQSSKRCLSCRYKEIRKSGINSHKKLPPREKKIFWPELIDLIKMIKNTNFSQTAKKLGVSDQAIRKHLLRAGFDWHQISKRFKS